jgi:hypothetical protein
MIGEIICEVYGSDPKDFKNSRESEAIIRDLIEIPVVAGCLFKAFD